MKAVVAEEPRIRWLAEDHAGFRLEPVRRRRIFRFHDGMSIAVLRGAGDGKSALAVYSRVRFGVWDIGVNRARVGRRVQALRAGRRYSPTASPSS